jgi:hypothetical protein
VGARGPSQLIRALRALLERFDKPQFVRGQERSTHLVTGQELPEAPRAFCRVRRHFGARCFWNAHGLFSSVTMARPNDVEFVENARGRVVYVSLARVDDGGPGGVASSQIAIIERAGPAGTRRVVGTFFTRGREAHGLWTNPSNTLLYVAHEQDELPGTPAAGQTVATAFEISNPLAPVFLAQTPLGSLNLPSGQLRNKKSINLVYVRPGARSQSA